MAKLGRPTVMTDEVLAKLEEAFAMGCTDKEACLYADISDDALYKYQREHPDFIKRKDALKETPILLARTTVINSLKDPKNAQWYLERKKKDEFSPRTEVTGQDGKPIPILASLNVSANNSDRESRKLIKTDKSLSGGYISEQNYIDSPATDTPGPDGQEANSD